MQETDTEIRPAVNFRGDDLSNFPLTFFPAPEKNRELGFIAIEREKGKYLLFRVMPIQEYEYVKAAILTSKYELVGDGWIEYDRKSQRLPLCLITAGGDSIEDIRATVFALQEIGTRGRLQKYEETQEKKTEAPVRATRKESGVCR